jgi:putative ABC transport system permease protein
MFTLSHDLRLSFRQLRKARSFAFAVVIILALGIGATTAIFSLVEGVLLRPLPFSDPDRLVLLGDHIGGGPNTPVTAREIETYSTATRAFSSMGAYTGAVCEISGGAIPQTIQAARLTAGVFPTLGVSPTLGRIFTKQEEDAHQQVAVISYALWLNRYQRDPHVLGTSIVLDRQPYTIIGVMPRDFEFPLQPGRLDHAELWVPMSLTAHELSDEAAGFWGYHMVARLKDGITLPQAGKDADRVSKQIMRNFPPTMSSLRIQGDVMLLRESLVADVRPLLRTLLFAVSIILLIACVNAAGLLLVRAIRGRREYAVRLALGARSGAIRQSILEGLLLSGTGGLLGLTLAAISIRAMLALLPESMPRIDSISIDAGVAGFAIVLSVITGALCSLAPAFAALRTNLIDTLKEGVQTTGATSHARLRSALVISEIAVAVILLTAAGAFLRSFQKMRGVDPGFHPEHVIVANYRLPVNQYPTRASVDAFRLEVQDRLSHKPGIVAAGFTSVLPASGFLPRSGYTVEGEAIDKWKLQFSMFTMIDGDYFRAMKIPLIEGRVFNENDNAKAPLVIVVNQSMAKHCWPGQEAIGKRMHAGNPKRGLPWLTVVGIVADTKPGPRDEPAIDQWYMPEEQPASLGISDPAGKLSSPAGGYLAARSALPPDQMIQTLRAAVADVDPLLGLQEVRPMTEAITNIEAPRRFNTALISTFALGALLLAMVGIYAVVAFSVSLRKQEIAIRMALGSQRGRIVQLVLTSAAKLTLVGCALGVLGALAVSQLIRSFLFQVSPTDPLIYTSAALIMFLLSLVACMLPATRAASADPIEGLRTT